MNSSYDECVEKIIKLYEYALNVIRGNIIQVYYYITNNNKNLILNKDEFLFKLAKEFGGERSGEEGVYKESEFSLNMRRDIDFIFSNYIKADAFRSSLEMYNGFYIHSGLWVAGCFNNVQTLHEILEKQKALISTICGEIKCDIKFENFAPVKIESGSKLKSNQKNNEENSSLSSSSSKLSLLEISSSSSLSSSSSTSLSSFSVIKNNQHSIHNYDHQYQQHESNIYYYHSQQPKIQKTIKTLSTVSPISPISSLSPSSSLSSHSHSTSSTSFSFSSLISSSVSS